VDHPRFERLKASPDRLHLAYHGGRLVDWVLRLADRWCNVRPAHAWSIRYPERATSEFSQSGDMSGQQSAAVAMGAPGRGAAASEAPSSVRAHAIAVSARD